MSLIVAFFLLATLTYICSLSSFAQTDMGNAGARYFGMEKAFFTVEEVVIGMVSVVSDFYPNILIRGFC